MVPRDVDNMKIKESFISLKSLRFHALHGVMPQERIVGNDYTVDCCCVYDITKAMAQITSGVNDSLGIDLKSALGGFLTAKAVSNK